MRLHSSVISCGKIIALFTMIKVQGLRRNVKNVVRNYSDVQIKVREATSNDPWGPSGTLMSEIADLSYNVVAFTEIMQVLWKRLNDHGKNWKHVYKALVLLEYLLKSGSERVAQQCRENIFVIETLKDFRHIEDNKDQGINIREKAKLIVCLLKDEERLKSERARALKARERFAQSSVDREEISEKKFNPADFKERHSSFDHGAVLSSELERVRPQTVGEEELQLQLALAVSKEEADQAERLKRNDELRLQMALSESKEVFEQSQKEKANKSSAMEDLIDVFVNQPAGDSAASSNVDPWGVPFSHSEKSLASSISGDLPLAAECSMNSTMTNSKSCYDFTGVKESLLVEARSSDDDDDCKLSAPAKFLGENANLVNLDALIESKPHGNPFQPPKPSQPSINELRAQCGSFSASTLPKPAVQPSIFTSSRNDYTLSRNFPHQSNNPFI